MIVYNHTMRGKQGERGASMKTYQEMSKEELQATYAELQKQFEEENEEDR